MRVLLAFPFALLCGCAFAAPCEFSAERSFDIDAASLRTLAIDAGSTDFVVEGDAALNRVEVRGTACASRADALDALQLTQSRAGDRAQVRAEARNTFTMNLFGSNYAYLRVHVRLPRTLALDIDTGSGDSEVSGVASLDFRSGSGDLKLRDVAGEAVLKVSSGDVRATDLGRLHLISTSSGDVQADGVRGDVEVGQGGSGDLDFSRVDGSVRIGTIGSGDVHVRDVGGDVRVDSIGSGDVTVAHVRGSLTVDRVGSGEVHYEDVAGRVQVPKGD